MLDRELLVARRSLRRSIPDLEALNDRRLRASFFVTNLADTGSGSLRDVIDQANAKSDVEDTITIQPPLAGGIVLDSDRSDGTSLSGWCFVIDENITIEGPRGNPALEMAGATCDLSKFKFRTFGSYWPLMR
jgi:hypothetical protein